MDGCECTKVKEITEVTESSKRAHERLDEHKERMDKLEESNKILHEMNTNIKVMVEQNTHRDNKIEGIENSLKGVKDDVKKIIEKPKENWDKVKWTIVTVVCTSLALFILSQIPSWLTGLAN